MSLLDVKNLRLWAFIAECIRLADALEYSAQYDIVSNQAGSPGVRGGGAAQANAQGDWPTAFSVPPGFPWYNPRHFSCIQGPPIGLPGTGRMEGVHISPRAKACLALGFASTWLACGWV